jgi:hypothetical protein
MKLSSAPLDDIHLELVAWLDDLDCRWSRSLRVAINMLYRAHCNVLIWLIGLSSRCSILSQHPERKHFA